MKRIIKVLVMIFAVITVMSAFACGKKKSNDKITLLVDLHGWAPTLNTTPTPENPKVIQTPQLIADAFTEKYPDIKIKWVRNKNVSALEEEMSQWFTTQIETNNCPTIAFSWGTKFQYNDWYVDLTEYLNKPNPFVEGNVRWRDMFEDYIFGKSNIRGMNGSIYAVPIFLYAGPATGWFYNKTVFANAGITQNPKTWKEFNETVQKIKSSGFAGTTAAPWSYFNAIQIDQWVALASLGPSFASIFFDETDYNKDGAVTEDEQVRATLQGYYSPVKHQYARDYYLELKKYYKEVLEEGWLNADYYNSWQNGSVAMKEDGIWRIIDEQSARGRDFETGVFPSPIISTDSYDYLPKVEYTEHGPYQPGVDFQLNIMKPAVKNDPKKLDAAVKFLQFFTQSEFLSLYAEEWGADLPATKDGTYSPLLNEWMQNSFAKIKDTGWPQAFVTEQNAKLNRLFAEWLGGRKGNDVFYRNVDEIQYEGARAAINKLNLDTTGWTE